MEPPRPPPYEGGERRNPTECAQCDQRFRPPRARRPEGAPRPAQERPESERVEDAHREASDDEQDRCQGHQRQAQAPHGGPGHSALQGLDTSLGASYSQDQLIGLAHDLLDLLNGLRDLLRTDGSDALLELLQCALNMLHGLFNGLGKPLIEHSDSVLAEPVHVDAHRPTIADGLSEIIQARSHRPLRCFEGLH